MSKPHNADRKARMKERRARYHARTANHPREPLPGSRVPSPFGKDAGGILEWTTYGLSLHASAEGNSIDPWVKLIGGQCFIRESELAKIDQAKRDELERGGFVRLADEIAREYFGETPLAGHPTFHDVRRPT